MIERVCQQCSKSFLAKESQGKFGRAKFCSLKCFYEFISRKISVKCQYCGKEFTTTPHRLKMGRGKFCSRACQGKARAYLIVSNETRQKMSLAQMGRVKKRVRKICKNCSKEFKVWLSVKERAQFCSKSCQHSFWKGKHRTPQMEIRKGEHLSPITEFRFGEHPSLKTEFKKGQHVSPRTEFTSEQIKLCWQDPHYRARVIAGRLKNRRPTGPERKLIEIIERHNLPFKYTGDGSFILEGLNPDFVEVNGEKIAIDVFGDYWHTLKADKPSYTEDGRKAIFAKYGWTLMVIWEREINSLEEEEICQRLSELATLTKLKTSTILKVAV